MKSRFLKPALVLWACLAAGAMAAAEASKPSDEDVFGEGAAESELSKATAAENDAKIEGTPLAMGGVISSTLSQSDISGLGYGEDPISALTQAWLFVDHQLSQDARALVRAKVRFDPVLQSFESLAPSILTSISNTGTAALPLSGTSDPVLSLEEAKIAFNIKRFAFVTLGRQKIKYGSGRFFNPTDFLNDIPRDIFLRQDERPGVDLIKIHVPLGSANAYGIFKLNEADQARKLGQYARLELPHNEMNKLIGGGELSLSAYAHEGQATKFGVDLSQSLWEFDCSLEVTAYKDAKEEWQYPHSVGASWEYKYGDRSSNTVTVQGEYLSAGSLGESLAAYIYLPEPLNIKDTRFLLINLSDLKTQTGILRADAIWQTTTELSLTLYKAERWGLPDRSLNPAGYDGDMGLRADLVF